MMNKLFMIVLSVCCLLMAACGTDSDETPQGLRIVDTDVDLAAGGGTAVSYTHLDVYKRQG